MTATVIEVRDIKVGSPRAVQIPGVLTDHDIDDVLYEFGFEWFGTDRGVQRLVHIADDSLDEEARFVMQHAKATLALWDRDIHDWIPLTAGDWVVEPRDGNDGFIKLSDADFRAKYEVLAS